MQVERERNIFDMQVERERERGTSLYVPISAPVHVCIYTPWYANDYMWQLRCEPRSKWLEASALFSAPCAMA